MTKNKNIAELMSKRKMNKKNKNLFSVIMTFEYQHNDGYEPSAFDLSDLSLYPDEEESILLPFTFLYLKSININSNNYTVDIDLEIIGKTEELEKKIKKGSIIEYDKVNHAMFTK